MKEGRKPIVKQDQLSKLVLMVLIQPVLKLLGILVAILLCWCWITILNDRTNCLVNCWIYFCFIYVSIFSDKNNVQARHSHHQGASQSIQSVVKRV
nr:hypothetical protein Q903MT_gene2053 [Picea sitchensis]